LDGAFLSIFSSKYGINNLAWGIQSTDAVERGQRCPASVVPIGMKGPKILGARAPSPAMSAKRETIAA